MSGRRSAELTAIPPSASMLRVVSEIRESMRGKSRMYRIGPADESVTPVITVLLVEDDEGDSILTTELLHDTGLPVSLTWRQSIGAAVPELATSPACVLLDLGLPDSQGFDGLRRVRELAPDAAVLVLTSANDESLGIARRHRRRPGLPGQGPGRRRHARPVHQVRDRAEASRRVRQATSRCRDQASRVRPARAGTAPHPDPQRRTALPLPQLSAWSRPGPARRRLL